VRAEAGACPFCKAALGTPQLIPGAAGRLARGAVFVFASSVIGCGGSTVGDPVTGDTGAAKDTATASDTAIDTMMPDFGNVAPPYGIPPDDAGTVDDTGSPMPKYGAPPIPDASTD
jgi:hypothetical protein